MYSVVEMMYVDISGRLVTGIAGSNPAGVMGVCVCVCVVSGVLSGGYLCDWPIPRPEESYRVWCV